MNYEACIHNYNNFEKPWNRYGNFMSAQNHYRNIVEKYSLIMINQSIEFSETKAYKGHLVNDIVESIVLKFFYKES